MRSAARNAQAIANLNACDALSQIAQDYRFAMLPVAWAQTRNRLTEQMFAQPAHCANGIVKSYQFLNSKIFQLTKLFPEKIS